MGKRLFFSILLSGFVSMSSLYANVTDGANLFQGTTHFKNGGTACIACHNVNSKLVPGGGKLAIDLTKMGGAGISYTIAKPQNASSAIMREAFKNEPITAGEQKNLIDFFNKVASDNASPSNTVGEFILYAVILVIILSLLLLLVGNKRKKLSVNQKLFDRQLKTSWKGENQ